MHKGNRREAHGLHDAAVSTITRRAQQLLPMCSHLRRNERARGPAHYPPKYRVSGSELLKRDFIQQKDTPGNLSVRASQALPQHKTGV